MRSPVREKEKRLEREPLSHEAAPVKALIEMLCVAEVLGEYVCLEGGAPPHQLSLPF